MWDIRISVIGRWEAYDHLNGKDSYKALFMRLRASQSNNRHLCLPQRCPFCLPELNSSSTDLLPLSNLITRYYRPQIQSNDYRKTMQLLASCPQSGHLVFEEIVKNDSDSEVMHQYLSFQETVCVIRGVVRERAEDGRAGSMHFHGQFFDILSRKERNLRRLRQNKKHTALCRNTADDQLLQLIIPKRVLKGLNTPVNQKQTNTSTIDLKRLTSNIDLMTKKISKLMPIHYPQARNKGKSRSKLKKSKMLVLKKEFQGISVIRKKEDSKKQRVKNHCRQEHETYGLERDKFKPFSPPIQKLSMRSLDKHIHISPLSLPQSPHPHLLQVPPAHQSSRNSHKGSLSRSRPGSTTVTSFPTSPSIHKSVSLGLSKTLSSKGVISRRKR